MRKAFIVFPGFAAICLAAACQQQATRREIQPAVQNAEERSSPRIDPADAAFGYTNSTGTRLLMLTDNNVVMDATKARAMESALCSDGRELPIRYLQFQNRGPKDNGRQSQYNFDNDEGHLFEISGAPVGAGDTCLLLPANYLRDFPIAKDDFPKAEREARLTDYRQKRSDADSRGQSLDLAPFQPAVGSGKESLDRIQKAKGRTAKAYWLLHRTAESQLVAAVEFSAVADSLLGSVVLAEPGRLSFFDMPASLKEGIARGGCWRVDDDCRFNFEEMDVPAVFGAPGGQLVFFTMWGAEGQNILLLQAKGGKLVELLRAYRYHAPI